MLKSIFLLLASLLATAHAGDLTFTLEGAVAQALRHHPELTVARLRLEEARGRLEQSGRLSNPELDLDFTRQTTGREGALEIGFLQRFPLTARLRHEKAVTRAELAAAQAETRDRERTLAAEVRAVAIKLLALDAQRALRARQLAASRELTAFLQKRAESGEASSIEVAQVELEARKIEIESLQFSAQEAVLIGELRPLLGLADPSKSIRIRGELSAPAKVAPANDAASRPDVQAAQARANAAHAAAAQQRASRWEDIGVGATYSRARTKDEPSSTETEQVVGLKVSIPLPFWNRNAGRIHEAEAAAARTVAEMEATQLRARAEAGAARDEMTALARLLAELDATLLPKAREVEEQLRNSYAAGLLPLTDVLRARTQSLDLQGQRLTALRDYHLARARYTAALGQP